MSARSGPWAGRTPLDRAGAVALLRRAGSIEVAAADGWLWIRGDSLDAELERRLRRTPDLTIFRILPGGRLLEPGRHLPVATLPSGPWEALEAWAVPALQPPRAPGRVPAAVPLALVRTQVEEEPGALVTDGASWREWAERAPAARLGRISFAVAADGRVLVRGRPLPPIRGTRCVDREGVLVPAGWKWTPPVDPAAIRRLLDLGPGDAALLHPGGGWELVPAEGLLAADRSSARASTEGTEP